MAQAEDLTQLHIADLHAMAAEAGVNGYRMLGRDELIAEIQAGGKRKRSRWPRRKAPDVDAETKTDELKIVDDADDADKGDEASAGDDTGSSDEPSEPKPARRRGRRGGRGRGGGGGGRERL